MLEKREQFSISLRAQKKSKVLALKRRRNERVLTKAKFLCYQAENSTAPGQYRVKSPQVLADILMQVDIGLQYPFGDDRCFKVSDLIQIIKEMHHIGNSKIVSPQYEYFMSDKTAPRILLHLMTKEYNSTSADKNSTAGNDGGFVQVDELVDLLTEVMGTLSCCAIDDRFMTELSREYSMVSLMQ